MPAVRCYSGSRDQGKIDQKREYISVNGKAAFSSLETIYLVTLAVNSGHIERRRTLCRECQHYLITLCREPGQRQLVHVIHSTCDRHVPTPQRGIT